MPSAQRKKTPPERSKARGASRCGRVLLAEGVLPLGGGRLAAILSARESIGEQVLDKSARDAAAASSALTCRARHVLSERTAEVAAFAGIVAPLAARGV